MENRKSVKIIFGFFLLAVFASPFFAFAYDNNTAHRALTQEIIKLFNHNYPNLKLASSEIDIVIKGSKDEDASGRWMKHFYDPVHKRGLVYGKKWESSKKWAKDTRNQAKGDLVYGAVLGSVTLPYFGSATDFSWDRAVYEYAWGNKERALYTLGHILHLIEDATVPAHTRNDPHPGLGKIIEQKFPELPLGKVANYLEKINNTDESYYEAYTSKFDLGSLSVANDLEKKDKKPLILKSLDEYFDNTAGYSNNNFFSRDTIFDKVYKEPKVDFRREKKLKNNSTHIFGYRKVNNVDLPLVEIIPIFNFKKGVFIKKYSIKDEDKFILSNYWNLLSQKSVLNGAGIVKLFFDEVKREKQTMALLNKNKSVLAKAVGVAGDFLKKSSESVKDTIANALESIKGSVLKQGVEVASTRNLAAAVDVSGVLPKADGSDAVPPSQGDVSPSSVGVATPSAVKKFTHDADLRALAIQIATAREALNRTSAAVDIVVANAAAVSEPEPTPSAKSAPAKPKFAISQPYPGFGGGGGGGGVSAPASVSTPTPAAKKADKDENKDKDKDKKQDDKQDDKPNDVDTTPPSAPAVLSPSDFSKTFTSPDIIFSGTAEASSTVSAIFADGDLSAPTATTTADSVGAWSLPLSFNQGSSTVEFFAADAVGNVSSSTEISLFVDSEAPDISLQIAECADSLTDKKCFLATTTLNIFWSSNAPDLSFFTINANGSFSTTTATSTVAIADDNSTYSFSVSAVDIHGNRSATSTQIIEISTMPVVINEIAWAGTGKATANDEWIELYNRTDNDINLSGWTLYSETDMKPYIVFGQDSKNKITVNGIIPAKGYYLIERSDASTTSETEDWHGSFGNGLSNAGEVLVLSHASTTIDRTPDRAISGWAGGINYYTMERRDPNLSGIEPENWGTNNGIIVNGKNAEGDIINGTPKARNSVNYLIGGGRPVISPALEITLTKENSPYIVAGRKAFASTTKLIIEPGVVIKFVDGAGFNFTGGSKIIANGTKEDPIIFTSFRDDKYGGYLNGVSSEYTPSKGSWYGVRIATNNNDSVFDHSIFRFGGGADTSFGRANLNIIKTSTAISNSTFEQSAGYGLLLLTSSSTISDSVFKNSDKAPGMSGTSAGLRTVNSTTTLSNVLFENNYFGIWSDSMSKFYATGVVFKDNYSSTSPEGLL